MRRSYRAIPDNPTGYPLNPCREWFSLVVPESTTNLFTNPSFETGTTGWTTTGGVGAALARSATYQYKGAYSAAVTSGGLILDYAQVVGPAVTVSTLYTLSLFVRRASKGAITATDIRAYVNGAAANFDTIAYVGDGWHRCVKTFQATVTTAVGFRVYTPGGTTGTPQTLYIDALQLEAKGYATTYCDGDQLGLLPTGLEPTPYYWTGTPHASTSVRAATTRAGGRELTLDRYGFTLLGLLGAGLTSRVNVSTELGLLDGSLYQTTIREARALTLAGAFEASNPYQLSKYRSALRAALAHDLTGVKQPALWFAQRYQDRQPIGGRAQIVASYTDGLEGSEEQVFSEKATIKLAQYQPGLIGSADRGATVAGGTAVSAAYVLGQTGGTWAGLGTDLNAAAADIVAGPDGKLYVGGGFTTAGGSSANRIATWDGSAWAALGTGLGSSASVLLFDSSGNLYVGGAFTTAGGGAANRIAKWNGSAWSALGTGMDSTVLGLAIHPITGDLYAVGNFTTAGGGSANYIAKWNGSAWSALGSGFDLGASAIAFDAAGNLYAGGSFSTAGGSSAAYVAMWDGSAWSAMGSGMNGVVNTLTVGSDGTVYAGGLFTTADGSSANRVAAWNGTAWQPMGTGLTGGNVTRLTFIDGTLYAAGSFTTASVALPSQMATWNGSSWQPVAIANSAQVNALASLNNTFYAAFNTSAASTIGTSAALTNPGTMAAPLTVAITYTSATTIYSLTNVTTGKTAYFNLTAQAGERLIIAYISGILQVSSAARGVIAGAVLPAADPDALLLIPGSNTIGMLTSQASATVDYWLTPLFDGFDGLTGK